MSKIRILPDHLANQIAAGEVVERPASVIKELVENSLDAGATRIEVEVEGSGTRLMRIIDNGSGMNEDDLLMSLERHGTSKIREQEDLGAISTLGFRGEAIPSIGSVAKLAMVSRTGENELGSKVVFEYGKLLKSHETGCSIGTTMEVRSLFGNTPARRKFLRTARTEIGHIEEVMRNYALGCPEVSFILRVDGKETLNLDLNMTLAERLSRVMHYDGKFISITGKMNQGLELERRIQGWLVPPETVTTGPARLRLFVNGRAVRDRLMIHAVTEGLRGFLLKGKNPSGLIILTVNPSEIDVNVHPAKHEIRFRNAGDVHTFIVQAVIRAMEEQQRQLQERIFRPKENTNSWESPVEHTPAQPEQALSDTPKSWSEIRPVTPLDHRTEVPLQPLLKNTEPIPRQNTAQTVHEIAEAEERYQETPTDFRAVAETALSSEQSAEIPAGPDGETSSDAEKAILNLRIIGTFDDLYIFCQGPAGLVVIDQHAAHERLLYEKLRKQYLAGKVPSQTLMFPETVELSLLHTKLLEKNLAELERMGFSLRDFGGSTFVISAVPALSKGASGRELLLDVLEQFGTEEGNRSSKGGDYLDHILATMACRAAVKAHTALSNREIEGLLAEMARADLFSHCPHGRPVVKIFDKDDVKKWFYRT